MSNKIAIIRIRGMTGIKREIKDTLNMLGLQKKNVCVIVPNTPAYIGMIKKVQSYVTYGDIDDETEKLLFEKRGKEYKGRVKDSKGKIEYNKFVELGGKKYKPYFRLNNPKGGFERKGIKMPFTKGGVLGPRKEKINDLIKRMV